MQTSLLLGMLPTGHSTITDYLPARCGNENVADVYGVKQFSLISACVVIIFKIFVLLWNDWLQGSFGMEPFAAASKIQQCKEVMPYARQLPSLHSNF